MAPTHVHQLMSRSISSTSTFTITFAVVAAVAILLCILWALSPYICHKYFPPKVSQTAFNQPRRAGEGRGGERTGSSFSHTPQSWGRSGGSGIAMYNPRTQTPFPNFPRNDSSESTLNALTGYREPPQTLTHNQSSAVFTLPQGHYFSPSILGSGRYEKPKKQVRSSRAKTPVASRDFGDAKDYILSVPEPLRVSRKAIKNDPVPLTRLPSSDGTSLPSTGSEKLLHPNKLFEQIKEEDSLTGEHSSMNMKIQDTSDSNETGTVFGSRREEKARESGSPVNNGSFMIAPEDDISRPVTPMSSDSDDSESSPHNASIAAMHRLKTYRSLVGAPPPVPLQRAGTMTRGNISVSKMRNLYDRVASESKIQSTVSRNDTCSTQAGTVAGSSDRRSFSTSATSPLKTAHNQFNASSVSLLPTPLRLMRSDSQAAQDAAPIGGSNAQNHIVEPGSPDTQAKIPRNEVFQQSLHRPLQSGVSESTSNTLKPRPAPLTLASSTHVPMRPKNPPAQVSLRAESSSRFADRRAIPSLAASSIYSRNTKGLSFAPTDSFPNLVAQPSFSPSFQSTIRGVSEADTETKLLPKTGYQQANASKKKVEDWNAQMVDGFRFEFDSKTSPSSSLKRAHSSLRPEEDRLSQLDLTPSTSGVALQTGDMNGARYRQSTISTEMAPSELALSTVDMPTLRISGFSNLFNLSDYSGMAETRGNNNIGNEQRRHRRQGESPAVPTRFSTLRNSWSDPALVALSVRSNNRDRNRRPVHQDDSNWI